MEKCHTAALIYSDSRFETWFFRGNLAAEASSRGGAMTSRRLSIFAGAFVPVCVTFVPMQAQGGGAGGGWQAVPPAGGAGGGRRGGGAGGAAAVTPGNLITGA